MEMIVCVKQVLDPETPAASFKIDPEAKKAIPAKDKPMVMNPFDANALEAALKIKDEHGGKVSILSMGGNSAREVINYGLAMGADEGFHLNDSSYNDSDSFATACVLTEAIKKIGRYDMIFCGRQDADWDAGQVGSGISELLGITGISPVKDIKINNDKAIVERVLADGYEILETSLPLLVAVSNEIGEPRYATIKGILAAKKKQITIWTSGDIPMVLPKNKILRLFVPVRETRCEFIDGKTPEEAGFNLAMKLRNDKII